MSKASILIDRYANHGVLITKVDPVAEPTIEIKTAVTHMDSSHALDVDKAYYMYDQRLTLTEMIRSLVYRSKRLVMSHGKLVNKSREKIYPEHLTKIHFEIYKYEDRIYIVQFTRKTQAAIIYGKQDDLRFLINKARDWNYEGPDNP